MIQRYFADVQSHLAVQEFFVQIVHEKMTVHLLLLWTDIQRRFGTERLLWNRISSGKQLATESGCSLSIWLIHFFIAAKQSCVFLQITEDNQSLLSRLMIWEICKLACNLAETFWVIQWSFCLRLMQLLVISWYWIIGMPVWAFTMPGPGRLDSILVGSTTGQVVFNHWAKTHIGN